MTVCTAPRHSWSDFSRGLCRCPTGREAFRLYRKRHREGRLGPLLVDATGTRRRLQGLMADGYSTQQIATEMGLCDASRVHQIFRSTMVRRSTATAATQLVERLGDRPGTSERAVRRAAKLGYVPLWAWTHTTIEDPEAQPQLDPGETVDEIAIERAMRGERVQLNAAEFGEAVARLASAPLFHTDTRMATLLHRGEPKIVAARDAAGIPRNRRASQQQEAA